MAFFRDFDRLLKDAEANTDSDALKDLVTLLEYNDSLFEIVSDIDRMALLVDTLKARRDEEFNEYSITKAIWYPKRKLLSDDRRPAAGLGDKELYLRLVKEGVADLEKLADRMDVSPDNALGPIESEDIVSAEYTTIKKQAAVTMEELSAIKERIDELSNLNLSIMSKVEFLNNGIFSMLRYISSSERMKDVQTAAIGSRKGKAMAQKEKKRLAEELQRRLEDIQRKELEYLETARESRYKSEDYESAKNKVARNIKKIGVLLDQLNIQVGPSVGEITIKEVTRYSLSEIQERFLDAAIKPLVELEKSIPQLATQWEENARFHANHHRFLSIVTTALLELAARTERLRELTVKKRDREVDPQCARPVAEDPNALHCWEYGDVLSAVDDASRKTADRSVRVQCCEKHRKEILDVYDDALYSETYVSNRVRSWTMFLKGVWNL